MLHYMTVRQISEVEKITRELSNLPYTEEVTSQIIFSSIKAEGRTKAFLDDYSKKFAEEGGSYPPSSKLMPISVHDF